MKIAIIGSRTCPEVNIASYIEINPEAIISGGAKGADTYARKYAIEKGIPLIEYLPDYKTYGRIAPIIRNRQIIDACDSVLAFWDGKSHGTKRAIDYAKSQGKIVRIIEI